MAKPAKPPANHLNQGNHQNHSNHRHRGLLGKLMSVTELPGRVKNRYKEWRLYASGRVPTHSESVKLSRKLAFIHEKMKIQAATLTTSQLESLTRRAVRIQEILDRGSRQTPPPRHKR